MGCGCDDIHTLHAELIHKAAEIEFQIAYLNGLLPASISDIDKKNVQQALESYWSKVGIPIVGEYPGGAKNNNNLLFTTQFEFIPGTLEVFLSGLKLNGNPADVDRDYEEFVTNNGFEIKINPAKAHTLNRPPKQNEAFTVNYKKRITFDTKGGT